MQQREKMSILTHILVLSFQKDKEEGRFFYSHLLGEVSGHQAINQFWNYFPPVMAPDCLRKTQLYFHVNKKVLRNFEYATQCYTPVLLH